MEHINLGIDIYSGEHLAYTFFTAVDKKQFLDMINLTANDKDMVQLFLLAVMSLNSISVGAMRRRDYLEYLKKSGMHDNYIGALRSNMYGQKSSEESE